MSKTIAVLSDTHGVLRPEVVQGIMGCDAIIHAGDFADGDVLSDLEAIAPLYAVQGNNDWELAGKLPESLLFQPPYSKAAFASLSASSLPSTPVCPATFTNSTISR